ncbi:Lrp/AsnC family transcriptional regulator [Streptomyces sp. SCSIO 75703]|uniref:Lrp/AsnC family transcriptional regulator n=1 Tax=unclassified Streptomyces TaxID=2593676 RepID=UPI0004BFCC57|nr:MULTISPECIES: Lrp/AsnC family transcriptional regulator [unclassified Streptomyces]
MDMADEAILQLLKSDGRLAHREIARRSGLSRSTVAARLQRLLTSGEVEVRGVVHPAVIGRGSLAHASLSVTGRAEPVAARIAERDDVPFVSLTSGLASIIAEIRAGSTLRVDEVVGALRSLDGVRTVETLPYTEVLRDVIGPVGEVTHEVDEVDIALLRALQDDGRVPYVELARLVGLSPAGVRRRVVRLLEGEVVRVGALVRQSGEDNQLSMGLGIQLDGGHREVTRALLDMPAISFLARTLGRFDLLATVRTFMHGQLTETLETVRSLPGVSAVDSWSHLRFVKETYAVAELGG